MRELHLIEGGEPVVLQLDDAVGEAISKASIADAVRVGGGDWSIAPGTKVGVATVGNLMIWIRPKVDIAHVLFLLGYARRPGWRDDTVTMAEIPDLIPALAHAFVSQAERAIEAGLLQGYTEVDDSLTVLRGRLREQDQLRQRFGIALPLLVRFDEHTVDIAENMLMRGATELLLRTPGVPTSVRTRLRGVRQRLAAVTPPVPGGPLPTWTATRLNERYHVALWLAELLLRRNAVDHRPGTISLQGFLVDMATVYEDFLTAAITESFRPHGGWISAQDRHYLDIANEVAMRPDVVWYRGGTPAAVIDAKYKAEKPSGFPDADLYQMLAYCTALCLGDGHLVYAKGNATPRRHVVRHANVTIHAHTLNLASSPVELVAHVAALASQIEASSKVGEPI